MAEHLEAVARCVPFFNTLIFLVSIIEALLALQQHARTTDRGIFITLNMLGYAL
ncbi:MAG: hypothetical protein L3K52_12310 [Candidatus Thiothrix sulfatifontis]|nr:MAG: hypothetical protein L3K52_12310 [Candidatus Thiothrix sulfatifontis]